MKGIIILPKYLEKYWTPTTPTFENVLSAQAPLFYGISNALNFNLVYADEVRVPNTTDVVFMFGVPYHNRPSLVPGLLDLNKHIKLVMYPGDLQYYDNLLCYKNRLKVFERCDLILSGSKEYFSKLYPEFLSKHRFVPFFFSPTMRYKAFNINRNPKMRCLLSGSLNPDVYKLRAFIHDSRPNLIEYKPPTYIGSDYVKLLNSYFCCVATSSIFNYAVAKYFEIPASGSLLIGNDIDDLRIAGFIPDRHYVSITKENVLDKIEHCLRNPKEYESVRKDGMTFVRENHSVDIRVRQIKAMLEELMDNG